MAKVFLSHSTKQLASEDDGVRIRARAIRDRAFDALTAAGHEALLDKRRLAVGDDWYATLHRWLGQCDGAVVIVDPQGLRSDWLRKEAAILTWRRSQVEDFKLVTVLVGDLEPAQLQQAGLEDLMRYQVINAAPRDIEDAVGQVTAAFEGSGPLVDSSPMASWIHDAATLLGRAGDRLGPAAECLGVQQADLQAYDDQEVTVAYALLHADASVATNALRELLGMPGDAFRELVRLVKPVCVELAAGASLRRLVDGSQRRRAIVNFPSAGVGRVYLDRARLRRQLRTDGVEIDGVVGEGGEREIEDALRKALLNGSAQNKAMPSRFRDLQSPEQQDRLLAYHFNKPEKFFLLIGRAAHHGILERLSSEMPKATFILLPPSEEATACSESMRVPIVEPRLEEDSHMALLSRLTDLDNLEMEAG